MICFPINITNHNDNAAVYKNNSYSKNANHLLVLFLNAELSWLFVCLFSFCTEVTPLLCALADVVQLTSLVQILRQLRGFPASGLTSYNQELVLFHSSYEFVSVLINGKVFRLRVSCCPAGLFRLGHTVDKSSEKAVIMCSFAKTVENGNRE